MKRLFSFLIFILLSMMVMSVYATTIPNAVMQMAKTYFADAQKTDRLKIPTQKNEIETVYQSDDTIQNKVFALQQPNNGFVVITDINNDVQIIGYSQHQSLQKDNLPDSFKSLMKYLERQAHSENKSVTEVFAATPVVSPMLDQANIHLNQFSHEEFGGCPSGCVATALVQIMAYYKYPQSGYGSHCYNTKYYGEHCADFQNTIYNWNNPSTDDFIKLSKHVGVATEMDYCGDDSGYQTGSVPGIRDYIDKFCLYFKYHSVQQYTPLVEYLYLELNEGRPVYITLPGSPGHALVADGYDSNGFVHLNFGWGGMSDGYYQLNIGGFLEYSGLYSNMLDVAFLSDKSIPVNASDSLSLIALNQVIYTKWDTQKPVAQWSGVKLAGGRVVELDLTGGRHLEGEIPEAIGNLTQLHKLEMAGNITGDFPASIYNLTQLRTLVVSSYQNQLNTPLSPKIGQLTQLKELEITRCWSGQIPDEIGNLTKLQTIKLWANTLSGNIPSSITNLQQLYTLYLPENGLSGTITDEISQLPNLTSINLSKNSFSGSIPENLGSLKKLQSLDLAANQLEGNLPESFSNLTKLTELDVSENQLSGAVTPIFDSMNDLRSLALNNNQFTQIPDNIGNLSSLKTIYLHHNLLENLSETIGQLTELSALDLSYNDLTDLPISIARLGKLRELVLKHNKITQFPMALINLSGLERLDLSYNELTSVPEVLRLITPAFLYLQHNDMSGTIPEEILKRKYSHFMIEGNRFIYKDIPRSDSILNPVGDQQTVAVTADKIGVIPNDTMHINAKKIIQNTSPGDIYSWYAFDATDAEKRGKLLMTDSVLTIIGTPETYKKRFYCVITNEDMPTYLYNGYAQFNSLNSLSTDTFSLRQWTEQEYLNEKYQTHVHQSESLKQTDISDRFVHLVSPWKVRGSKLWQASSDNQNWHDLSMGMSQTDLKNNLVSMDENELVLFPKTAAWYRSALLETQCVPRYSDTIKVVPFGEIICDTIVDVSTTDQAIALDSIEVIIPAGLVDGNVRMSIIQSDKFTIMPDSVLEHGPIYEVHLDCGSNFDKPLIVKFKLSDFDPMKIENYRPAYFDELLQEWVFYDNSSINFEDSTMTFITDHLTKLSRFNLVHPGYTHIFTNEKVNVIYNNQAAYMNVIDILYHPKAAKDPNPWYDTNIDPDNNGAPYLVQDVAHYMKEIIDSFTAKGLKHPSLRFNVYLKNLGGAAGQTDAGTYLAGRGYIYLDPDFSTSMKEDIKGKREYMKSVLAHEYMHFTQDYYMTVMLSNYFWMEATAPLADRIVWPTEAQLALAEPEQLLSEALKTTSSESSIFDVLSRPWYNSWNVPIVSKLVSGSKSAEMNLASLFLHYMRTYRPGSKLDPVELLKQTPYTKTWVGYLDSFIKQNLSDGKTDVNIGTEYDNYVRFLYGGSSDKFNVFYKQNDENADHLQYLKANYKSFINKHIRLKPNQTKTTEEVKFSLGNLSSQMVQIFNMNSYKKMLVQYYRKSKPENVSVYVGKYNLANKILEWTDVSKKDTITFVTGFYNPSSPEDNEYMSYILFVNKSSGDILNTSFADEMECMPLPDLQYFDGLLFARKGTTTPLAIHSIEESVDFKTLFGSGASDMSPSVYRVFASSFNSTMSLNQTITDSTIVAHAQSEIINQYFVYNFIKGTLTITHSMRLHNAGIDFEEDFSGSFTNVWFKSNGMNKWTANRYSSNTDNSAETQSSIKNMYYKFKSIRPYIDSDGTPKTDEIVRTYTKTQYPYGDIALYWAFY